MVEIDVFGNVIEKKSERQELKEVVKHPKKQILEEVITPDDSVIIDEIPTIEQAPKKKGGRKKKTVEETVTE